MANRRPPQREGQGHGHGPARGKRPAGPPRREGPPAPRRPAPGEGEGEPRGLERLQKVLAHGGIGSRRACEDVILQGRVTVDGQVVRELGTKVDAQHARIEVDGQRIRLERMVYFALSKPKGYVSTNNDPAGRPRVIDLLPEIPQRVYTVGRLDEMSTGLMLLTNDGELANRLAHPKFGVEKLYRVVVAGNPERTVLEKLTEGVWLAEGKVRARRVRVVGHRGQAAILEMVLAEGKNREVRRMLAKLGHKVMSLTRIAVGPITLKGLAPGESRSLSQAEVELLRRVAAGLTVAPARFPERKPRAGSRPRPASAEGGRRDTAREGSGGPPPRPPYRAGAPRPSGAGRPSSPSGARPPRPEGPPPSQRPPSSAGGARGRAPVGGPRRSDSAGPTGARPPRPEGPPPSQRPPSSAGGPRGRAPVGGPRRSDSVGPTGARPPRPAGPPLSRRPASSGGPPPRPVRLARPPVPRDEPPPRRIIGLASGPAGEGPPRPRVRRTPPKRRFPRAALGQRRPPDEGEE